ncbi:AsnC family transcriptional regulator [Comamonas phosphati]|nr:AsnC family transcriptional regulator [Comamonas phosphati]
MPAADLDSFDRAILAQLQHNNLTPQRLIAERVNLSAPAVQRRIKRLHEEGVIAGNVAVLEPAKVGRTLTAVITVQLLNDRPDLSRSWRARVAQEAAVQQCYYVTGETDYVLIVTAADMEDYQAITRRLFEGDDNIRRYSTSIALERVKTGQQVPLRA